MKRTNRGTPLRDKWIKEEKLMMRENQISPLPTERERERRVKGARGGPHTNACKANRRNGKKWKGAGQKSVKSLDAVFMHAVSMLRCTQFCSGAQNIN